MKQTTIKISVTQDGLLPEEVTLLGKIFIPAIQKQILKSTGFEKIDDSTYAGVMPVKIIANAKVQEIEFEIGAIPDFRKKVVEFVNVVSLQDFIEPEPEPVVWRSCSFLLHVIFHTPPHLLSVRLYIHNRFPSLSDGDSEIQ